MNLSQAILLGHVARFFSLTCDERNDVEIRNAYLAGAGNEVIMVHTHSLMHIRNYSRICEYRKFQFFFDVISMFSKCIIYFPKLTLDY